MKVFGFLTVVVLFLAAVYGYIENIVKLFHLDHLSGEMAVRIVGIIAGPLGIILGYL